MATFNQFEANRLNARKSTGPRTPAGKEASRFNALKHGIDARCTVIPGEMHEDLEALAVEYQDQLRPETPVERYLVDTLIYSDWCRRRLMRVQAGLFGALVTDDVHGTVGDYIQGAAGPDSFTKIFRQLNAWSAAISAPSRNSAASKRNATSRSRSNSPNPNQIAPRQGEFPHPTPRKCGELGSFHQVRRSATPGPRPLAGASMCPA